MNYKLTKLKNGLRVITVPIPNFESLTITIWVGVGSRYEDPKTLGLSHFLEHMVFKGSKKRPTAKKIAEAIDEFGGEFNASTSKEWTNFYIKAPQTKLETAMDVLSDMVLNPLIIQKEIDKEKGVILEEMAMYEDNPMAKIEDVYENLIYSNNKLGRDIIGSKETIPGINRDDFVRYRSMHYSSNNLVVTIAGGFDEKKTLNMVEKYFSGLKKKTDVKYDPFKKTYSKPEVFLKSKEIEQCHLIMGFSGYPMWHKSRFAEAVLDSILGGGMSSRMFSEVREKRGLAYAVRTSADHYLDAGSFSTYAGVDIKKADKAVSVILDQYYGLRDKKYKITKKEFSKAKEFLKGHLALSLEDTRNINSFFGVKQILLGKTETPEEIFKSIDKVDIDQVYEVAKELFRKEKLNLALIGPFKSASVFERLVN